MKKYCYFLMSLFTTYLNTSAQDYGIKKILSVDISQFYETEICNSCVQIIPQQTELGNSIFFYFSDKNSFLEYDLSENKIKKDIKIDFGDSIRVISPFFLDKRGTIYCLTLRTNDNNEVIKIKTKGKGGLHRSNLTQAWIVDKYNTPRDLSSAVTRKGKCILNLVRTYNHTTKRDYFEQYAKTPVVGSYDVRYMNAKGYPIHFYRLLADEPKRRLVNNFWFFDLVESNGCMFFQNMCADTIYEYHIKTKSTKRIIPFGSKYDILPIWFNPTSEDISDIFLKQNLATNIFVDYPRKRIFRRLGINLEEGKRYILQILNLEGEVLTEKMLDPKYINFIRLGSKIYLLAKENKHIELYEIYL